jgi:hypothetical protein
MNHREPPALAIWMLDHLTSKGSNEPLSGDLLETFRAGRSSGWYWYQVIVAIAITCGRNVWHRRTILLFAAIWSLFSPGWGLLNIWFESSLYPHVWRLPFPWLTICAFALGLVAVMLFVWIGIAIYSVLHLLALGKFTLQSVRKGFLYGLAAYVLVSACVFVIGIYYPHPAGHAVDRRTLTMLGELENFGIGYVLQRLQYFIGTAITLWFLAPGDEPERVRAA